MISALEIVWPVSLRDRGDGLLIPDQVCLDGIISILSNAFPNMTYLYLGLKLDDPGNARVDLTDMLRHLDEFMSQTSTLKSFTVSITERPFEQLMKAVQEAIVSEGQTDPSAGHLDLEFWRFVNGSCALVRIERNPVPRRLPIRLKIKDATPRNGYWVVRGDRGLQRPVIYGCIGLT